MGQNFSDRLRNARLERGLSQAELAARAGMQPSAISHFETGERAPSFENLQRLANALGASIDGLLGRASDRMPAGPQVEQLYRHFRNLSAEDRDTLAQMAKLLAERNAAKHGRQLDE
jgi:transcriptional regulator with XRE-family HTH domain